MKNSKFLRLYTYSFVTKGAKRFSIYDSLNEELYFCDNQNHYFLELIEKYTINDILIKNNFSKKQKADFNTFVDFLISNKLAFYTNNNKLFPPISTEWESNKNNKKAIIDIRDKIFNFDLIFNQLSELKCHTIEIRCFNLLNIKDIHLISEKFNEKSIEKLVFLFPYGNLSMFMNNIKTIEKIILNDYRVFFFIYNTPPEFYGSIDFKGITDNKNIIFNIQFIESDIEGCENCGNIDVERFSAIPIEDFMERMNYNGCLNRQIAIDENGDIKNCPSMKKTYGNIKNSDSITEIYNSSSFRELWEISKDKIDTCNVCELRYLCGDCRAYTEKDNDLYSKPSKCNYDPTI